MRQNKKVDLPIKRKLYVTLFILFWFIGDKFEKILWFGTSCSQYFRYTASRHGRGGVPCQTHRSAAVPRPRYNPVVTVVSYPPQM